MTVLVDGKYYEDATYNTQFISVMNGEAVPVPDEVPDPEVADNGKVLTVVEGVAAWADLPVETVEMPVSAVADSGKVLTVNGEGEPAWQAPTHPVVGATEPTDTSVLWVDTAGAKPVLKVYITDAWVAVVDTAGE